MTARQAFTLIELLVVLSIISLLAGMAMTMLTTSRRTASINATKAIMSKVDGALRQFKVDTGAFPFQATYADVDGGDRPTNQLDRHLGRRLTTVEASALADDLAAASTAYAYDCSPSASAQEDRWPVEQVGSLSGVAFRISWLLPALHGTSDTENLMSYAVQLNRLAQERGRLAVLAGFPQLGGPRIYGGQDRSATPMIANPQSAGWSDDYLGAELESRYRKDGAVLDSWKRPLAYVCQVVPGVRGTTGWIFNRSLRPFDPAWYGLAPSGRLRVSVNGGDVQPPADPTYLPDPAQPFASDLRWYAAPGFEREFELWSTGPDGRMSWMRNSSANRDNVAGGDYLRGLR